MTTRSRYLVASALIIISVMVIAMGCTDIDSHERYTPATITEKFSERQPMMPLMVPSAMGSEWYDYDYYVRYTSEGVQKADRVSKDTYTSVLEGNTYVLKWGYIDDYDCINKEYGYVGVVL